MVSPTTKIVHRSGTSESQSNLHGSLGHNILFFKHSENIVFIKKSQKALIFINFHWFSLISLIFIDFGDFMKYARQVVSGSPLQTGGKTFPPRKRTFRKCLRKFENIFYVFALSGLGLVPPGTVESWEAPKPLIFIDFHWFSLIFIDFHWFQLIFIDFHWFKKSS